MPFLSTNDHAHYRAHGWLHMSRVFDPAMTRRLCQDLDAMAQDWGGTVTGWNLPAGMAAPVDASLLIMHQLELYSPAWDEARRQPRLVQTVAELLDGPVEYLGSSTHSKPAHTGAPFPMHQDSRYYDHADPRLLICMLHLDDTDESMGPIAFDGGWRDRHLPHVDEEHPGPRATYLDPARWPIERARPVTCRAGDVVLFNIFTIHGSLPNRSDRPRRAVVFRFRHPANRQTREGLVAIPDGRDRMGRMVVGTRPPRAGFAAPVGGDTERPAVRVQG